MQAALLILSGCGGGSGDTNADASDQQASADQTAAVSSESTAHIMAVAGTGTRTRPSVSGRVFYINSATGNDANNGTSATSPSAGIGPWRTLAKLASFAIQPGDTVQLACGSTWNETLRLSASGTSTSPITVSALPAGCSNPPVINGGSTIASTAWKVHKGSIYVATQTTAPLLVTMPSGVMTSAHHPNRGFDSTLPDSMYQRNAQDSDNAAINGRPASTYVTTGSDLALPAGASLTAGTVIRLRPNSWTLDQTTIASVSAARINLATPTSYPMGAGWGFFFLGQLWMLDSPGEWHYDKSQSKLYVWAPDSKAPGSSVTVATLDTGVDLSSRNYVTLSGLTVRNVGIGIRARRSTGVSILNSRVDTTSGNGIDAAASVSVTVTGNQLNRTGGDAISGFDPSVGTASGMKVVNNTIVDSGVAVSGNAVLSVPVRGLGAIRAGTAATVSQNRITNASYHGVFVSPGSAITSNVITGACSALDDCAGIYANGVNNGSSITGNLVIGSRGAMAGKPTTNQRTQAQGIYLDESASLVTVTDNTATDNDNGIQVHVSANNVIRGNKLYGNRVSQLWMQETRNADNAAGDIFGNEFTSNLLVSTTPATNTIYLDTIYKDTVHFGSFDANRFFDSIIPTVLYERTSLSGRYYDLTQWQAATTASGQSRMNEVNGWGTSQTLFAPALVNGSNAVPNGNLASNAYGWSVWNQTAPNASLVREACPPGWCARLVTGGSPSMLISPNFSIVAGTWYRLTMDVSTGNDNQTVDLIVRRGGGGSNGYERLSDRSLMFSARRTWTRYSFAFKATKTVNAADPITLDKGARIDVQNVQPGAVVSVANLELVPTSPIDGTIRSDLLLNTSAASTQVACPVAATQASLCANYVRLTDNQPITWPYSLAPRSSEIVYTRNSTLIDSDGDGIADSQDACSNTPLNTGVNSRGCELGR